MGKSKQRIKELEERVKALEMNDVIFNTIFSRKSDPNIPVCNIISSHYLDLIKQCGGNTGMIEVVTREWNRRVLLKTNN